MFSYTEQPNEIDTIIICIFPERKYNHKIQKNLRTLPEAAQAVSRIAGQLPKQLLPVNSYEVPGQCLKKLIKYILKQ